jgi:hypothetical protein
MADKKDKDRLGGDANRDPLTGAPGAHPVGVGVGAAGGAAAGAAVGAVAGPAGSAVGAVVGGVAGGLAGKGAAEAVNPTVEEAYWRDNYSKRPYVTAGSTYDTYRPAYQYGWESYGRYRGRSFDEVEPELSRNWESKKNKLSWDRAREASRDAWQRLDSRDEEEDSTPRR